MDLLGLFPVSRSIKFQMYLARLIQVDHTFIALNRSWHTFQVQVKLCSRRSLRILFYVECEKDVGVGTITKFSKVLQCGGNTFSYFPGPPERNSKRKTVLGTVRDVDYFRCSEGFVQLPQRYWIRTGMPFVLAINFQYPYQTLKSKAQWPDLGCRTLCGSLLRGCNPPGELFSLDTFASE